MKKDVYKRKNRDLADKAFHELMSFADSLSDRYPGVFSKPVCFYPEHLYPEHHYPDIQDWDNIIEVSLYAPSVRSCRPAKAFFYNFRIFSNIRLRQRCIDAKNGEECSGAYPPMELLRAELNVGVVGREHDWCSEVVQGPAGKIYEGLGHFEESECINNKTHHYDLFVSYPCTKECFKSIERFLKLANSHALSTECAILKDRRPEFDKEREEYIRRNFKIVQDRLVNKS